MGPTRTAGRLCRAVRSSNSRQEERRLPATDDSRDTTAWDSARGLHLPGAHVGPLLQESTKREDASLLHGGRNARCDHRPVGVVFAATRHKPSTPKPSKRDEDGPRHTLQCSRRPAGAISTLWLKLVHGGRSSLRRESSIRTVHQVHVGSQETPNARRPDSTKPRTASL